MKQPAHRETSSPGPEHAANRAIQRVLQGEVNAFEILVERYKNLVAHIVFRMVSQPTDREELCQEVFIKAFQKLASFRFESKFSTWIGRIAYNTCVNYLKKKKIPLVQDELAPAPNLQYGASDASLRITRSVHAQTPQPDELYERDELANLVQREIDHLPPVHRVIITLFHQQDMSIKDIATMMQLPEGTVKSHLFRARQRLKRRLLQTYQTEDIFR